MSLDEKAAKVLWKADVVSIDMDDPYVFNKGFLSPIYCDNRVLLSSVEDRKEIIDLTLQLMDNASLEFDYIAGVATGGIPLASWISERWEVPMVYVRGERKDYGKKNLVEGELEEGAIYLVVDDLVSSGGSLADAASSLREVGGKVGESVCIFTFSFEDIGGNLAAADLDMISLINFETLVDVGVIDGFISPEQAAEIRSWHEDPEDWRSEQET